MKQAQALEVSHLIKRFGRHSAVKDISFTVRMGEIVGLLGPNGAGKTTTIAMLLGVTTPTSGSIRYFGLDFPANRRDILSRINYASAYTRPPWRLTVREHLSVFANLYGVGDPAARIASLLRSFQLEEHRDTLCGDLSAGNMARVNLCRAFINHPELALLDEPTSSMDPDIAHQVREYLLMAQEKYGTSILITSHNMAEIEELCDRVIFISRGTIIAQGTPEELVRQTLPMTRVRLYMRDGQKRTLAYCGAHSIQVRAKDRYVEMDVKEADVSVLLAGLAKKGVVYSEITVIKPTLEDYFVGEAGDEA